MVDGEVAGGEVVWWRGGLVARWFGGEVVWWRGGSWRGGLVARW